MENTMFKKLLYFVLYVSLCSGRHILETNDISAESKAKQIDVDGYLEKFGYLPPSNEASLRSYSEDTRIHAIRLFQKFAHLPPTGEMNRETAAKMRLPRCGNPDVTMNERLDLTKPLKLQNTTQILRRRSKKQPKWTNKTITWKIQTYTDTLTRDEQRTAMINSLQRWENASDIRFVETDGAANINIAFLTGDHGDGTYNAFDGPGGVLAHAFPPIDGRTHFDHEEHWVFHETNGTELEMTATHELGHSLGLGHSLVRGSLMVPFYQPYREKFTLHSNDVDAIQYIYGPPSIPPTLIPGPETVTMEPEVQIDQRLCNSNIDAVTSGPDGMLHMFIGPVVYKIQLKCQGEASACIVQGFPKPIRKVFKKGPKRVHAAVFLPDHRQRTYLFKGRKVWRYKGYKLDQGYPKQFSKKVLPYKPSAAYIQKNQFSDYQMYIFGRKYFWEINLDNEDIVNTALKTKVYWDYVPNKPHAFVQTRDGSMYVFKGKRYNKFDHRRVIMEKRKLTVKDLLGVDCGV